MAASVTIERKNIWGNAAQIQYSRSNYFLPESITGTWENWLQESQRKIDYVYSNLQQIWSFDGKAGIEGSYIITGLTIGSKNIWSWTFKATCTQTAIYYTRTKLSDGSWSEPSITTRDSLYSLASYSGELTIYTKGNSFEWIPKIESGKKIQIYASKWNELVDKSEIWANWYYQEDGHDFSSCKVKPKDFISSSIYNDLVKKIKIEEVQKKDIIQEVQKGDIIKASHFNNLMYRVNGG